MMRHENSGDNEVRRFVVDMLITHLLNTRQLQLLKSLLDGVLKNATAGKAYPYHEVKNIILDSSVYSKSLIPACTLLRVLFSPTSKAGSNYQYQKAVQIIRAAIISGSVKKVKVMCEIWSKDERVILRKADKDDLCQILDRNNEQMKKTFTDTDEKPATKPNTTNVKNVGGELQRALSSGDLEKAKQIWLTGSEHILAALGLVLAEKLYFAKMVDDFRSTVLKLKQLHGDLSYHAMIAVCFFFFPPDFLWKRTGVFRKSLGRRR
ncbi:unnamed protein product [Gongylonema pulchrum]|uniref:Uncharacterized protein n=1 Tax=Gongylonema pulchrum TaxID=637853 RepID=A0A3P7QJC8_9BILA|nr:unnamed protein product [Gongylonema pulchrum]